jgi:hypothetical protein
MIDIFNECVIINDLMLLTVNQMCSGSIYCHVFRDIRRELPLSIDNACLCVHRFTKQ